MKTGTSISTARALSLLLSLSPALLSPASLHAQDNGPVRFNGVFNDYSPASPTVKGSPWEMHGQWSLDVTANGIAAFQADMTMSGYGTTAAGLPDATQGGVNPHTHHLKLSNAQILPDMTGCPVVSPPTTIGFQVKGTVTLVTGNGGPAPFETTPPTSTLQVCVTGGTDVPFSNLSLVFGGPATKHFGTGAIHGVVRSVTINGIEVPNLQ